jgi:predicted AAA+ superfamily ATPase
MKRLVKRKIFSEIIKWLDDDRIIIIKGARRTGKTTLLNQLKEILLTKNQNVVIFSADQEFDNPAFENSKLFYKFLIEQYYKPDKKLYVLIDECQYLPNASMFLKTLYDLSQDKFKIIVTGSSILELLKNKEPLTGRKIEFTLERFSFSEYLSFASEYEYSETFKIENFKEIKEFYQLYHRDLKQYFIEYINWGGYPEVCTEKNFEKKKVYLKEIVKTYIEKDIAQFFRVENILKFNNLIKLLCYQKAQLLNRSEISNTIGIHLKTLEKYLNLLEGTFIITMLPPYYSNIRKEISKMPKIFINDIGIIKYYTNFKFQDFNLIDGLLMENFVFTQLKNKNIDMLFYYRTISKSEIDFILNTESGLIPAEVKFRKKVSIPVSIKNFIKNYSKNTEYAIIFTQDYIAKKDNFFFIPVILTEFLDF